MPRPVIGLTTYAEEARFGLQDTVAAVLPLSYVQAVHACGGRAVLITPDDPDPDVLSCLSGIVFTGGSDIDPSLYGEAPHPTTQLRPARDRAELLLMGAARRAGLPLLGICRGMQLMAVAYGGRLHQHLPDVLGHHDHRPTRGHASGASPTFGQHEIVTTPGSAVQAVLGDRVMVNSFHHQGVADAGTLRVTARCERDGLIEAVEDPDLPFAVGVQWHPEEAVADPMFHALITAASAQVARVPLAREDPSPDRRATA